MRFGDKTSDKTHIFLSRKNLQSLLAKLDGAPENSAMTILKELPEGVLVVTAEENDEHYINGFAPGIMHPDTEEAIVKDF